MTVKMSCILFVALSISISYGLNCPNQQFIEESLRKVHIPGAVILVVNATHTLYEQVFGYHSLSPMQPMDTDASIFTLASISKTFVGVAVMQLVEKELVDLDTDINKYLSEPHRKIFHPQYSSHSITLRRLLSHSASIAVSNHDVNTYFQPDDIALTRTSLAELCFTYLNPNTSNWLPKPPGSVSFYSNEGSSLAALVVERVAKTPYDQYVKENILKPLGIDIRKAGFYLADIENRQELVNHYAYAFNESFLLGWKQAMPLLNLTMITESLHTWIHIPFFSFSDYPAGLLRMSARSLLSYLRMFINNGSPLVTPRSIAEMRTIVGDGLISYYGQSSDSISVQFSSLPKFGLGWYWETLKNGRQYVGHSGGVPGMANLMLVNEKNTIGVILLSNGDSTPAINLSIEIMETIANIHSLLFDCFETDLVNSFAF